MAIRLILALAFGLNVSGCELQNHEKPTSAQGSVPIKAPASSLALNSQVDNRDLPTAQCMITDSMIGKVAVGQTLADLKKNIPEAEFEVFIDGDGISLIAIKFRDYEVVTPNISNDSRIDSIWVDDDEKNICQTSSGLRVGIEIVQGAYGNLKVSSVNRRAIDVIQTLNIHNFSSTIKLASFNAADFEGDSLVSNTILSKVRVDRIYVSRI